jgi:hypothetical protein
MPIAPPAPRWLAYVLGAVAFAADALHVIAARFAMPKTVDAVARDHVERCRDVVEGRDPPAWARAIGRDIDADIELRVAEMRRLADSEIVARANRGKVAA